MAKSPLRLALAWEEACMLVVELTINLFKQILATVFQTGDAHSKQPRTMLPSDVLVFTQASDPCQ
jgi:hypothetical protein